MKLSSSMAAKSSRLGVEMLSAALAMWSPQLDAAAGPSPRDPSGIMPVRLTE
jgi:hypothetical protein